MLTDDMRAAFESWYSDRHKWPAAIERRGDGYILAGAQGAWEIWQAATLASSSAAREDAERYRADLSAAIVDALPTRLRSLGSDFVSHPVSRGVDDCEEAGNLMLEAAATVATGDSERLDWLEKDRDEMVFRIGRNWYWHMGWGRTHRRASSLRAAIDAARGIVTRQGGDANAAPVPQGLEPGPQDAPKDSRDTARSATQGISATDTSAGDRG